jgi:hypothetical protein
MIGDERGNSGEDIAVACGVDGVQASTSQLKVPAATPVAARQLAFCFSSFGTLRRDVDHRWPIFLINLIFGTTIGWIGSMIWACYSRPANSPYTIIPTYLDGYVIRRTTQACRTVNRACKLTPCL